MNYNHGRHGVLGVKVLGGSGWGPLLHLIPHLFLSSFHFSTVSYSIKA